MVQDVTESATGSLGAKNMTSQVPLPMAECGEKCCAGISFLSPLPTLSQGCEAAQEGRQAGYFLSGADILAGEQTPCESSCSDSWRSFPESLKGSVCFAKRPSQNCFLELWEGGFQGVRGWQGACLFLGCQCTGVMVRPEAASSPRPQNKPGPFCLRETHRSQCRAEGPRTQGEG